MDSLSHGASKLKAIKDTKGFNNRGVRGEGRGWRLFRQVCSRVISQMDFALLCRKLHATLYFPFSRRDDVSLVSLTLGSPPPFRSINLLKFNVGRILLLFLYFIIRPADKLGSEAETREERQRNPHIRNNSLSWIIDYSFIRVEMNEIERFFQHVSSSINFLS